MKGYLICVNDSEKTGVIDFDYSNALNEYYRLLDCDVIDIVTRRIGEYDFDIVLDDCGLLKNNWIPGAICDDEQLAGNLLILPNDVNEDGDYYRDLTQDEINQIKSKIHIVGVLDENDCLNIYEAIVGYEFC